MAGVPGNLSGKMLFGEYQIEGELGRGGMGVVYRVRDRHLLYPFAAKLFFDGEGDRVVRNPEFHERRKKRFLEEARTLLSFNHANIINIRHLSYDENLQCYGILMQLCVYTLQHFIDKEPKSHDYAFITSVFDQVAAGLDHAHEKDHIHRDVKPRNILLDEDYHVYVSDFGVALNRQLRPDSRLTVFGSPGDPDYMSPEQHDGMKELTAASDVYSLGVTIYETLTKQLPYGTIADSRYQPPSQLADLPLAVDSVLEKAMALNPSDRYQECSQLSAALRETLLPSRVPTAPTHRTPDRAPKSPSTGAGNSIPSTISLIDLSDEKRFPLRYQEMPRPAFGDLTQEMRRISDPLRALDATYQRTMVKLLEKVFAVNSHRRLLIEKALGNTSFIHQFINYNIEPADAFAEYIIQQLLNYGHLGTNEPALLRLLQVAAELIHGSEETLQLLFNYVRDLSFPPPVYVIYDVNSDSDKEFALRLVQQLKHFDLSARTSTQQFILGSESWDQVTRDMIRLSYIALLVESSSALAAPNVWQERDYAAIYYGLEVVPVQHGTNFQLGQPSDFIFETVDNLNRPDITHLAAYLNQRKPKVIQQALQPALEKPPSPYKGLDPFTDSDQENFHGRSQLMREILEQFKTRLQHRQPLLLPIIGESGSGKSSLAMAGILPALQRGEVQNSQTWYYLNRLVPGDRPLDNLAEQFEHAIKFRSRSTILEDLHIPSGEGINTLANFLLAEEKKERLVIFIDQFEELFTHPVAPEIGEHFMRLLVRALQRPDGKVVIILTLRADFMNFILSDREFGSLVNESALLMVPMGPEELKETIVEPANNIGLQVNNQLIGELLADVRNEAGALPLLQFTLAKLYEQSNGQLLMLEAYRQIGGLRGALARHADEVYKQLPSDVHRQQVRHIFRRLVNVEDINNPLRRRMNLSELKSSGNLNTIRREVIEAFVKARLLTPLRDHVEVSHEALLREWKTLREWLVRYQEDFLFGQRLTRKAQQWVEDPEDAPLLSSREVENAQIWVEHNVASTLEVEYIQASVARQQREEIAGKWRRRQRYGVVALGLLLLAIGATGLYLQEARIADEVRTRLSRLSEESLNAISAFAERQTDSRTDSCVITVSEATSVTGEVVIGSFALANNTTFTLEPSTSASFVGRTPDRQHWVIGTDTDEGPRWGVVPVSSTLVPPSDCVPPLWGVHDTAAVSQIADTASDIGLDAWHGAGFTGGGVRVGILGTRFSGATDDFLASAPNFVVLGPDDEDPVTFLTDNTDPLHQLYPQDDLPLLHILNILAPDAEFYVTRVSQNPALFEQGVRRVLDNDVDIILHTDVAISPVTRGPIMRDVVRQVLDQDILWVNAAGDYGTSYYSAPFMSVEFGFPGADHLFRDPNQGTNTVARSLMVAVNQTGQPAVALNWIAPGSAPDARFDLRAYSHPDLIDTNANGSAISDDSLAYIWSDDLNELLRSTTTIRDARRISLDSEFSRVGFDGVYEPNLLYLQVMDLAGQIPPNTSFELVIRDALPASLDPHIVYSLDPVVLPPADIEHPLLLTVGAYDPITDGLTWYTSRTNGWQAANGVPLKPDLSALGSIDLQVGEQIITSEGTATAAAVVTGTAVSLLSTEHYDVAAVRQILVDNVVCHTSGAHSGAVGVVQGRLQLAAPDAVQSQTRPVCGLYAWQPDTALQNHNETLMPLQLELLSPFPEFDRVVLSGQHSVVGIVRGDERLFGGFLMEMSTDERPEEWQPLIAEDANAQTGVVLNCEHAVTQTFEINDEFFTIDTTQYANGLYHLRLRLCDRWGREVAQQSASLEIRN